MLGLIVGIVRYNLQNLTTDPTMARIRQKLQSSSASLIRIVVNNGEFANTTL
jgi:hypothetical protein